jgi:hypothetical protein
MPLPVPPRRTHPGGRAAHIYWLTLPGYLALLAPQEPGRPLDGRGARRGGWMLTEAGQRELDARPRG